jgi:hypothetical protein
MLMHSRKLVKNGAFADIRITRKNNASPAQRTTSILSASAFLSATKLPQTLYIIGDLKKPRLTQQTFSPTRKPISQSLLPNGVSLCENAITALWFSLSSLKNIKKHLSTFYAEAVFYVICKQIEIGVIRCTLCVAGSIRSDL